MPRALHIDGKHVGQCPTSLGAGEESLRRTEILRPAFQLGDRSPESLYPLLLLHPEPRWRCQDVSQ